MVSSRAGSDAVAASENRTVSDGHLIDKVVYAVYVKEYDNTQTWNGQYRLLSQYGDGTEGLGEGQALLPSTENLRSEAGETLTLRLMRGQEYVIGFWAQNKDCTAYDSKDLEAVVVDYTAGSGALAANNDETRDAFCQVYTFTAQIGVTERVVLKRALAQINVGTAGWDYNEEVEYGNNYAYSKIVMRGIHNRLNVLTGEVTRTDDFDGNVVYDWAVLPAYMGGDGHPEAYPADTEADRAQFAEWLTSKDNNKEYLYVKLTEEPDYLPYLEEQPEEAGKKVSTEIFKYLSMCYVLAPTAAYTGDSGVGGGFAIDELKFYLAEFVEDGEGYIYEDEAATNKVVAPVRFTIPVVPVQRNWRTNILGGINGDSDSSLFDPRALSLWIDLSPSYDGDHYHYDSGSGDSDKDKESSEWSQKED
ncbi:MAG: hypothetical protein J1E04_04450 [Alistipes sp.]|nr:hypothetical protein [Alistipes sp.]